jgi:hypothetical protein
MHLLEQIHYRRRFETILLESRQRSDTREEMRHEQL